MTFCSECGSKLEPGERFCGTCGTPAASESTAAAPPSAAAAPAGPPPPAAPPTTVMPAAAPTPPAPPSRSRTLLWLAAGAIVAATVAGVALVVSGDDARDDALGAGTSEPAESSAVSALPDSALPATTVATTTAPPSTVPATTVAPTTTAASTTTVAPTTMPPTTASPAPTVPVVAAGWTPAEFISQAFPPPFEANWLGAPSPPIVDQSAPLPDGVYAASYVAQDPSTLQLEIRRFESCDVIGEPSCYPGPYDISDLGISEVVEGTVSVPLDTSTRFVVHGWACDPVIAEGNGAEMSALYAALAQDYDAAFGPGLADGTEPSLIVETVRAFPVGGFGIPTCDDGFSLEWRFDGAPPVLVQWPFDFVTDGPVDPATLLLPTAVEVEGPNTTVYLYAGFFS